MAILYVFMEISLYENREGGCVNKGADSTSGELLFLSSFVVAWRGGAVIKRPLIFRSDDTLLSYSKAPATLSPSEFISHPLG